MAAGGKGAGDLIPNAILLAGPTASGKSGLALELAKSHGRTIVNTDSMQVYALLEKLSARPSPEDLAQAPHRLYGHVHPSTPYSVGHWAAEVRALHSAGAFADTPPIFVGGTGLYFRALAEGLSVMPEVPPAIRMRWRERLAEEGPQALHRQLAAHDPEGALALRAGDGQRIARALEVLEATGRPIRAWQGRAEPLIDSATSRRVVLVPDVAVLHRRIEARFRHMVAAGALDEAAAIKALHLDPGAPALKAIGLRELAEVLGGTSSLEHAIARATVATRQYAKRQMTWFRHQFGPDWLRVPVAENVLPPDLARLVAEAIREPTAC